LKILKALRAAQNAPAGRMFETPELDFVRILDSGLVTCRETKVVH